MGKQLSLQSEETVQGHAPGCWGTVAYTGSLLAWSLHWDNSHSQTVPKSVLKLAEAGDHSRPWFGCDHSILMGKRVWSGQLGGVFLADLSIRERSAQCTNTEVMLMPLLSVKCFFLVP